ncbi:MAG TPA: hypothetical protein VJT82_09590 [Pyrinomonadaceae bacterium]|nr:hypothetical protein [Pyrinomonadaceae bacterium]
MRHRLFLSPRSLRPPAAVLAESAHPATPSTKPPDASSLAPVANKNSRPRSSEFEVKPEVTA